MIAIGERIKKARLRAKLTQVELSEKIEVKQATVSDWENDKVMPDLENIVALCREIDISIDALLSDKESKSVAHLQVKTPRTVKFENLELIPFPEMHELKVVEGRASANWNPTSAPMIDTVWVDKRFHSDKHYGIVVHGSSMANTISEGDIAVVRKQGWVLEEFDPERGPALKHEWKKLHNKIVLACVNGEEPLCKRLYIQDLPNSKTGFFIQLSSDNCQAPPKPIWREDRLEVLGIVVAAVRMFERPGEK